MAAIILLCVLALVIVGGITWFVLAKRKQTGDHLVNNLTEASMTSSHHTSLRDALYPGYPFPKSPGTQSPPGQNENDAPYQKAEFPREENLGELPWD